MMMSICLHVQAISRPKPPAMLAGTYPLSEYKKTQAYNIDKWCASLPQCERS